MDDQKEPRKEQSSPLRGPEENESGYVTSPNTVENAVPATPNSTSTGASEVAPTAKPFPGAAPLCKLAYMKYVAECIPIVGLSLI